MSSIKMIFNQALMISTAIFFGLGVQAAIIYLTGGGDRIVWDWYIPLTIILNGFLCALPSFFVWNLDEYSKRETIIRISLHFVSVFGMISVFGYIFRWYTDMFDYLIILIMYVIIYNSVWIYSIWIAKNDEIKINKAIKEIQDEE